MSQTALFFVALLSGVCFGSMSWSYQMGRKWKVPANQVAFVALMTGCLFFLGYLYYQHRVQGLPPGNPWKAPWPVWVFTIMGGMGQVATIALIDPAQKRGPSAPVFCAMNLIFLPAALYAVGVLKEYITPLQCLGLVAALGCVLVAGKAQPVSAFAPLVRSRMDFLLYPLFLLGLMVSSSLATIAMKQLQAMPCGSTTLLTCHQGLFLFLTYGCGGVGTGLILTHTGWSQFQTRRALLLGGFSALGSIGGFLTFCLISALPGGIGFALANIAGFVTIALIAVFLFKEKRTPAWYLTLLLAILGVGLFALGLNR
jgi:drug/metabolite transporter (DMT)-like permease